MIGHIRKGGVCWEWPLGQRLLYKTDVWCKTIMYLYVPTAFNPED